MKRADFLKKAYDRRHAMLADHEAKNSYAEIGRRHSVTRQRAFALVTQARREKDAGK